MKKLKTRVCVVSIIQKNGRILMGKHVKDVGPYPNCWLVLGGGVNLQEESLRDAMKREIKEEANIEIKNIEPISFREDYEKNKKGLLTHYLFLTYKADYKSGKIKSGDDIVELKWFSKKDLPKLKLARPSIRLFKQLGWLK